MKIAVLGAGAWGTALAMVLVKNGHEVTLWSRREEHVRQMEETRENVMLKGVHLPAEMHFSSDLSCVENCGAVLLVTPSYAVRDTSRRIAPFLKAGTLLVTASKGIEKESSLTFTDVIAQEVGPDFPVAALSGPSHAEEVGREMPTTVVVASKDRAAAELGQDLFMNERFRVYTSDDPIGVELAGALKNVIALCAGCCDGMGFGDNTKAALMTRGLSEIARLGEALGGRKETFAGLAGVGDLIVTCTSMHSRNRRCGILLGQGKAVSEAMEEVGAVVEGYYATATAKVLADKQGVEMPITEAAYQVLYEGKDPRVVIAELMTRKRKQEIEENWV